MINSKDAKVFANVAKKKPSSACLCEGLFLRLRFKSGLQTVGPSDVISVVLVLVLSVASATKADNRLSAETWKEAAKLLPDRLGKFEAKGPPGEVVGIVSKWLSPEAFAVTSRAMRLYLSRDGNEFLALAIVTRSESAAYALLTDELVGEGGPSDYIKLGDIGTANLTVPSHVAFIAGPVFLEVVTGGRKEPEIFEQAANLARLFEQTLERAEGDIPVLVKHLPDWQNSQKHAQYFVSQEALLQRISNEPALKELKFEGGTEAVAANYGQSQLLIVEFTTPQLADENDQRITAKIQELRAQGQPVPTAYRRVGNYGVFVFNAPDEKTANQLIDQVEYEQVVQWLGENPHWFERAQKLWAQTSAAVLIAVLETSGLSALLCLALGGTIGAIVFQRRRAQAAATFSDAGGMVRLDLDELTAPPDTDRLLAEAQSQPERKAPQ